ncbi:MAG: dehydratase [Candidatus Marinimicrobia bacterium]|nr:dehydratase [Candidatus Neomarinimicrobiota bacterium]|tara:strand:- start:22843 stop:24006 length:1164 start_codon:yes stop_codon:yes gene_type:complete
MKITDYKTYVIGTPWRNLTLLVIETDSSILGIGEARVVGKTHTVIEYLKDVKRHIIGADVTNIEDLYRRFTHLDFGAPGEVVMTGLALVEMACWDAIGKKTNMPVYKLLGGKVNDKILAYANGWYQVERTPNEFHDAAKSVMDAGYKAMKFDPFGNGDLELTRDEFHRSISLIEAVHAAAQKDAEILIEMHGRFAPHQAVEIAKAIEHLSPAWIEEPCRPDDLDAIAYVRDHTSIPIATGERLYTAKQFNRIFEKRLVNIIQPDINQCGGIFEVKKIASTAENYSIMVAPHNVGGVISTTAALHLMVTLRNAKILEHFNDFVDSHVKKAGKPYPEVVDGYFHLPDGPGWGVELNIEFIESNPPKSDNGIILDPGLDMFRKTNWHQRF